MGVELFDGYLIVSETVDESGSSQPSKKRAKPRSVFQWKAREIPEVLSEGKVLVTDLLTSLETRKSTLVHEASAILYGCLDFICLLKLFCGHACSETDRRPFNRVNAAKYGCREFSEFAQHVSSLPQIANDDELSFDEFLIQEIYSSIKSVVESVI